MTSEAGAALVTGASRGIGRALALELARQGLSVGVNFRKQAQEASQVVEEIEKGGGRALALPGDVSSAQDRAKLLDQTQKELGPLRVLANNAGMAPESRNDLLEATEESYDRVMAVNLKAPYFLSQAAARLMLQNKKLWDKPLCPMIINIGSISAEAASISRGEYCLSKAGLSMMSRLFAARLAPEGILVYEIRPGIVETDMTGSVKDKYDKLIGQGLLPQPRWGEPVDVARALGALVRGDFAYSTGQVFHVDGGFQLRRL